MFNYRFLRCQIRAMPMPITPWTSGSNQRWQMLATSSLSRPQNAIWNDLGGDLDLCFFIFNILKFHQVPFYQLPSPEVICSFQWDVFGSCSGSNMQWLQLPVDLIGNPDLHGWGSTRSLAQTRSTKLVIKRASEEFRRRAGTDGQQGRYRIVSMTDLRLLWNLWFWDVQSKLISLVNFHPHNSHNYGKIHHLYWENSQFLSISMAMFNSYVIQITRGYYCQKMAWSGHNNGG